MDGDGDLVGGLAIRVGEREKVLERREDGWGEGGW